MDVVVKSNKKPQAYWFHVDGLEECDGLQSKVMVVYTGFNYTSMLMDNVESTYKFENKAVYGQYLESPKEAWHASEVKKVYLGIKRTIVQFKDSDNDFRYISDAIVKKPFYSSQLTLRENGVVQINAKSFLYPNAPYLTQFEDIKEDALCEIGVKHKDPQCVMTLTAPLNSVLELVFANEDDDNNNELYVFHLHGYKMQVMTTHFQSEGGAPMSLDTFNELDQKGQIKRNILHPPFKDTLVVPNKGYTIARVMLDHAGAWLLECRSCGLSSLPTALVINVPQTLPKPVLDSLPKCGSYRPPDVLLN
ncbi:hypothetical protein EVAR_31868_1 [Eumeta japonica]|uniref:Plastocyanin-like domain-containing protein n=1 Tax=Eumeta variegata TaxID=151549 RepID=A0A4C1WV95_EUMVA|nr:hypothetical protein EVAR_31868_1 [Eumeta japonica]